ncbi:aspartic proteinase CDR1 [Cajanus cajan]|uniref:Aspartic proteinase nepenthesin-1 n=1 Tax=Cajanus cajan TaxID=3821 RepID=A0A151RGY3_CAJCA|nr:aspartic proteinase CDR1 [Cajanus cajan]KYP41695.1 Aspartic proteinase nepenthesin-1 [Cajanus cajan]
MASYSLFISLVLFCLNNLISLSKAHNNGFSVEIIHRDSISSPLYRATETEFERVVNAVRRSINRANHLGQSLVSPNTAEATVEGYEGEFLMSYSVGTPPFQLYGIVDTGSDIIWLQCEPCEECYNQTTPIFDPSKSKTYKTLPCTSTTCKSARRFSCSGEKCQYSINYGDGSHSQGDLSVETLTLGSTSGSSVQFPKTLLGCGHSNTGTFHGKASGIVGLGGGPMSLITQLGSSIAGKFSYCLAPLFTESKSSSKLNFGDAAVVSGAGTVSTPILPQEGKIFYFLNLEAFSVGNKRIEFGSSNSSNEEGNIIIDSGTTLTLLPDDVYSNLESAVADAVKLERVEDPSNLLSLCFQSTSNELDVPIITAHFSGADVKLNPINTFVEVADGIVCLAFRSSDTLAIFGNLAQQNLLVGYDLKKNILSFEPTDCSKK